MNAVKYFALTCLFAFAACSLSDIRPDTEFAPKAEDLERGRALLERSADAHGGLARLQKARAISLVMEDTWNGAAALFAPFPPGKMQHTILFGTDNSRIDFLDEKLLGTSWGVQNWETYKVSAEGTTFDDDADVRFWVATYAYFVEAPFRLREANVVYKTGEATIDGRDCELVFASWDAAEPQKNIDQYIAWIDKESGRLLRLQYTLRDMAGFLTGAMDFREAVELDGLVFPTLLVVSEKPGGPLEDAVHYARLEGLQLRPDLSVGSVVPEPGRARAKHPQ